MFYSGKEFENMTLVSHIPRSKVAPQVVQAFNAAVAIFIIIIIRLFIYSFTSSTPPHTRHYSYVYRRSFMSISGQVFLISLINPSVSSFIIHSYIQEINHLLFYK